MPRIEETRISVMHVADRIHFGGCSVEEVAAEVLPHLNEGQAWDALQYIFDSPHEIVRVEREWAQSKQRIRDQAATRPRDISDELRG